MESESFFSSGQAPDFLLFSLAHLVWIGLLTAIILGLYWARNMIRERKGLRLAVRYGLLGILLVSEVGLNAWYWAQGVWNVRHTLPFELCSITLLLSIIMLWNRSRGLYEVLFFAGIGGALQAILTPNLAYGFPHFRFFQFFIAHLAIILASLYMTWIERYRPTWKSIGKTMLFLNGLALAIGLLNYAIGANYMFLLHKPDTPSILDMLGPYPYYLLAEEGIALLLFIMMYVVFFVFTDKVKSRKTRRNERSRKPGDYIS
ncbi:TIGR02206 family membrane protein [Fontibacillus sp. BL9]|uniref:YwaF family protein n=1 Tax=Fontibacillus sp. BL9 TaxID=3389971 RepID=UPI00397A9DD2